MADLIALQGKLGGLLSIEKITADVYEVKGQDKLNGDVSFLTYADELQAVAQMFQNTDFKQQESLYNFSVRLSIVSQKRAYIIAHTEECNAVIQVDKEHVAIFGAILEESITT